MDEIYDHPRTLYERFVNAYCRSEKRFIPKEQLARNASDKWNELKKDEAVVEKYISSAPRATKYKQKKLNFGRVTTTDPTPSVEEVHPEPCEIVPSTNNSEKSPSLELLPVSDFSTDTSTTETAINFERHEVKVFFEKFSPSLITNDVIMNDSFISGFSKFVTKLSEFKLCESAYLSDGKRLTKTKLRDQLSDISEMVARLFEKMNEAGTVKLCMSSGTAQLSVMATKKNVLLTEILATAADIYNKIIETNIIYKLRKRKRQQINNSHKMFTTSELVVRCRNSSLTWQEAYPRFVFDAVDINNNISRVTIQYAAERVESETFVCTEDLGFDAGTKNSMVEILLSNFPIMHIQRGNDDVLVDIKGLVMHEDAFLKLLNVENPVPPSEVNEEQETSSPVVYGPRRKPGRKPLYEKYPKLVEIVTNFIKQHSFSAHGRRRETSGTGTGVTLSDIRSHVIRELPEMEDISQKSIHLLMVPPRKGTNASLRYKGLVNARIPKTGRNDYRENHENQHYLFARVAYRGEYCSKFKSECSFFSCDDMAKMRMGPVTAVSRYHQERRFFATNDSPNLPDHDTPNPGYLLNCSGYQKLVENDKKKTVVVDEAYTAIEQNDFSGVNVNGFENDAASGATPESSDQHFFFDKLGRRHYNRYMAGPVKLVLRAVKFSPSNAMHHANDILPLLEAEVQNGIGIVFIKVDNGGDWNLSNLVNQIYFCRLWKTSKLDLLGIVSYAARFSAYNNIEHFWAPMSKKLTSVILPSVLEGDEDVPYKLNLVDDEVRKKEGEVFDNAMKLIRDKYWKDATFNGYDVEVHVESSFENPSPFNDYDEVHDLMTGPYREAYHNKNMMRELRFLFKHIGKKSNEIIFQKCERPSCSHCTSVPIVAKEAWEALRKRDFKWPNPVPSEVHPGHFKTFLEVDSDSSPYLTGDSGLPFSLQVGECPTCLYMFMSVAERDKHLKLMHRDITGTGQRKKNVDVEHKCFFIIKENKCARRCNIVFQSKYELQAHKKLVGHTRGKKRKAVNVVEQQRTITDMLQTTANQVEDPEEEEEPEGHTCVPSSEDIDDSKCYNCEKMYGPGSGDWLLCSQCKKWFHEYCF